MHREPLRNRSSSLDPSFRPGPGWPHPVGADDTHRSPPWDRPPGSFAACKTLRPARAAANRSAAPPAPPGSCWDKRWPAGYGAPGRFGIASESSAPKPGCEQGDGTPGAPARGGSPRSRSDIQHLLGCAYLSQHHYFAHLFQLDQLFATIGPVLQRHLVQTLPLLVGGDQVHRAVHRPRRNRCHRPGRLGLVEQ